MTLFPKSSLTSKTATSRTGAPVRVPPLPPSSRESRGPPGGHTGCTPDLAAHVKPEHDAYAARAVESAVHQTVVMHYCQSCDQPVVMEHDRGQAVFPQCGRVDEHAALGPVFVVTGASGSGKTAVLAPLAPSSPPMPSAPETARSRPARPTCWNSQPTAPPSRKSPNAPPCHPEQSATTSPPPPPSSAPAIATRQSSWPVPAAGLTVGRVHSRRGGRTQRPGATPRISVRGLLIVC
jgi:hypothetical protein